MNARLIKRSALTIEKKCNRQQHEIPIIDTIQSWVREFQSTRGERVRLDLEQLCFISSRPQSVAGVPPLAAVEPPRANSEALRAVALDN